jgi:hypothetical protein
MGKGEGGEEEGLGNSWSRRGVRILVSNTFASFIAYLEFDRRA